MLKILSILSRDVLRKLMNRCPVCGEEFQIGKPGVCPHRYTEKHKEQEVDNV